MLISVLVSTSFTVSVWLLLPVWYRLLPVVPDETMSDVPSVMVSASVVVRVDGSSSVQVSVIVPASMSVGRAVRRGRGGRFAGAHRRDRTSGTL